MHYTLLTLMPSCRSMTPNRVGLRLWMPVAAAVDVHSSYCSPTSRYLEKTFYNPAAASVPGTLLHSQQCGLSQSKVAINTAAGAMRIYLVTSKRFSSTDQPCCRHEQHFHGCMAVRILSCHFLATRRASRLRVKAASAGDNVAPG